MQAIYNRIEVRHLRYFLALAEELSFAKAAARLHISQPPLTRQIKQLEDILEIQLFVRTTRNVEPTEAGLAFASEARAILARIEKGVAVAKRRASGAAGRLVVAFEASATSSLIPRAVRAFREKYPASELIVQSIDTDEQVDALGESRIDAGFIVPPIQREDIEFETVLTIPFVMVVPPEHRFAGMSSIDLAEFSREPFILSPHNHRCGLYDHIIAACKRAGFVPSVAQEAHDMQLMLGLISEGIGVSLLPEYVRDLQRPGVAYVTLAPGTGQIDLALAWRQPDKSAILSQFIEVVRDAARDLGSGPAGSEHGSIYRYAAPDPQRATG